MDELTRTNNKPLITIYAVLGASRSEPNGPINRRGIFYCFGRSRGDVIDCWALAAKEWQ